MQLKNVYAGKFLVTCLGLALFSGLQSGLIPIPCKPSLLAGKAHIRTYNDRYNATNEHHDVNIHHGTYHHVFFLK